MELKEFLVKAHRNMYAKDGEANENQLKDGAREIVYEKEGYKCRDRYFGFAPFIGEEVVWNKGKLIWGMNYYGKILAKEVSAKKVYEFLKKAMGKVEKDRPFRGPSNFKEGDFEYVDESAGEIDDFFGVEKIYYRTIQVYRLNYHGGNVKK